MQDRAMSFETTVGSKWLRIFWPQAADEPEIRWRVLHNGSPNTAINADLWAGARHVVVCWEAGKYDAKVTWKDFEASEARALSFVTGQRFEGDKSLDGI